jgi:tetratricopeptide (TPR) repeat protein
MVKEHNRKTRKRNRNPENRDRRQTPRIAFWRLMLIGVLAVPVIYGILYAVKIKNADADLQAGLAYLRSDQPQKYENAFFWLQRAVQNDPVNKRALYYLAAAYREKGAPERAAAVYQRLIERDPNFIQARYHLGVSLLGRREFTQAAEQLAAHLRTNNVYWQSYYALGYCYSELKRFGEAVAVLEEIERIHWIQNLPADKYLEVKKLLYLTYQEAGDAQGASRTLEAIKKIQP